MSVATAQTSTFDLLRSCIDNLGAAILAVWGVDDSGICRCPAKHKCRSPGKHPNSTLCPNGVKNATRDSAILRQWLRSAPRSNWALRCGDPLPGGGFLGAFDWDPRNGSAESLAQIHDRGDALPETVTAESGGGGGHRLYRFEASPASRSVAPGIDLQGAGKYIVIAPSRHYTGGSYSWDLGAGPGDIDVVEAPRWLQNGTDEAQPRPERDSSDTARETVLGEAFFLAGRAGPIMPNGEMFVDCVQSQLHTDARGRGQDASTIILPPAGGSRFGGYKCQHGHCANLKWDDVLKLLPKEAVDAAHRKYPRLSVVKAAPAVEEQPASSADTAAPAVELTPEQEEARQLKATERKVAYKDVKGTPKIISDIVNLNVILTYDPRWKGVLRFDEFAQTLRFTRAAPWHPDDAPKEQSEVWNDGHVTCLDLWLRRNWALEIPTQKIHESVYVVGKRDGVNPLTAYLDSVAWDGTPRLDTWLTAYGGCADTAYVRVAGRKWILSAVARAYDPGCKVDTLLVLEGAQGKGKSTLLRTLVPTGSWFSDTPIPIGEKDSYVALRGKWIIELAELASLKKADLDKTKAFFSSPVDSYRPPYGREQISVPRTCIFAGTVNLGEYLNDPTGARRFIPVRCGVIDLETLATDRDQLWAEAVAVYRAWVAEGRKQSACLWWPSPEELPMFEEEQIQRQVAGSNSPYTEAIALWAMSSQAKKMIETQGHVLIGDVARLALRIENKDLDTASMTGIGIVMARDLGWQKKRVHVGGARSWGYFPNNS